jgi:hypothetical protein
MVSKTKVRRKSPKARLTLRIPEEFDTLIEHEMLKKAWGKGDVVVAALKEYFDPTKEERRISAISQQLFNMDRKLQYLKDSDKINNELLSVYIRTWLFHNPNIPQKQHSDIKPQVELRMEQLFKIVVQNISEGKTTHDLLPDIAIKANKENFEKSSLLKGDK